MTFHTTTMRDLFTAIMYGLFLLSVVVAVVWFKVYRYNDCRNVGHTVFYCLTDK